MLVVALVSLLVIRLVVPVVVVLVVPLVALVVVLLVALVVALSGSPYKDIVCKCLRAGALVVEGNVEGTERQRAISHLVTAVECFHSFRISNNKYQSVSSYTGALVLFPLILPWIASAQTRCMVIN